MRIGINGRFLVAKRTGVQRAAYNLLQTLLKIDQENEYLIFTGRSEVEKSDWQRENVVVVGSDIREGESIRNHLWEQMTLPKLARAHNVDLLHSPANTAPLFYKGKSVVHIHDLCFVVNPQWYSFSFRTFYNFLIPRIARKAAKVITNSNNSKNDLLQFCDLPAERVSLIYWAVDDIFRTQGDEDRGIWPHEDYILYVGSLEPRKNIKLLVEAYELLRESHPDIKTKLILIGGESPLFRQVRLNIKKFKDDVIFKGFVDDHELKRFYRHARLVAYPSLYEGFGLPPLEAMASGTPVVTSMTSSLPEVVGDAAYLVSPHSVEQVASAMAEVIKDERLCQAMIARGYEQVRKFNWYRVARNTLALYYEVHHGSCAEAKTGNMFLPYETWQRLVDLEERWLESVAPRDMKS